MHTDAYRILQGGHVVAKEQGEHALRDIILRAGQYREEGPLAIQKRAGKRWRVFGEMVSVSDAIVSMQKETGTAEQWRQACE